MLDPKGLELARKEGSSSFKMTSSQIFSAFGFLLVATTLEVSGDAIVRLAIFNHASILRAALMISGQLSFSATDFLSIWRRWNFSWSSAFTSRRFSSSDK
jgi:hypothetical protein